MAKTKTVYLHDSGHFVIWGMSEYFEPSHLVKKQFRIDVETADSKDFRKLVATANEKVAQLTFENEELQTALKEANSQLQTNRRLVRSYKIFLRGLNKFQKWIIDSPE